MIPDIRKPRRAGRILRAIPSWIFPVAGTVALLTAFILALFLN
jgi:hypothetical protein